MEYRIEHDTMGEVRVPAEHFWGAQTERSLENFRIGTETIPREVIHAFAVLKSAAATANHALGKLPEAEAEAITDACRDICDGKYPEEFPLKVWQTGSGTQSNMNMNEVIAHIAMHDHPELKIHPNDHVNMSQSTNDVIPTAGKITVLKLLPQTIKELEKLEKAMEEKEAEFDDILKMGRTQLQDAVPMRLGQSFGAFAHVLKRDIKRLKNVMDEMKVLNIGATAIGTAINVDPYYLANISYELSKVAGISLKQADDLIDATQNLDGFVSVSGVLKTCAVDISKISNDLRLMSSGPRTGLSEINLPARQNGSSIMPGKINPVIPEVVSQVAYLIIGHDYTITMAAEAGQLELNAFEPVLFHHLFESIDTLKEAAATLTKHCITGITANKGQCEEYIEKSVGISTALCPYIGYAKSAEIAKKSLKTGVPVKELVLEEGFLQEEELKEILKPEKMTQPMREKVMKAVS